MFLQSVASLHKSSLMFFFPLSLKIEISPKINEKINNACDHEREQKAKCEQTRMDCKLKQFVATLLITCRGSFGKKKSNQTDTEVAERRKHRKQLLSAVSLCVCASPQLGVR